MEKASSPTVEYLKEVFWAVFMIDLIVVLVGVALERLAGWGGATRGFLVLAMLITLIFLTILAGHWLLASCIRLAARLLGRGEE